MSPPYIFRIDEIQETREAAHYATARYHWIPSTDRGAHVRIGGGASGTIWYCNRQQIYSLPQFPPGCALYKVFSVYYSEGHGFWVLRGDATNPPASETWHPLSFDHEGHEYSSFLTNAGQQPTLYCQRADQHWPRMLLPDIYHSRVPTTGTYGGLIGELPIFLALVAFSVARQLVPQILQQLFIGGAWITHNYPHGRLNQRGVVVYVYTCPSNYDGGSSEHDLDAFEKGNLGKYYH
ncbi:hypothetical protein K469DRAFT_804780 [Zopfia rhizophila CBS 207.26]|uniref:Uncharacterized protein n=1 Tax=Zopfia rhizophila CBS 207.26 TaxID=1314779 RepID=A0A6A6EM15_9PEZI|nr:hypothetical protein K469DRAFT_804780 [Zopfia rhizophila CBS 207.26]